MFIELMCDTIYEIITGILFWLEIPYIESFDTLTDIFVLASENGLNIFNFFMGGSTIGLMFELYMGLYGILFVYDVVMWVLRKIPMLNIK